MTEQQLKEEQLKTELRIEFAPKMALVAVTSNPELAKHPSDLVKQTLLLTDALILGILPEPVEEITSDTE